MLYLACSTYKINKKCLKTQFLYFCFCKKLNEPSKDCCGYCSCTLCQIKKTVCLLIAILRKSHRKYLSGYKIKKVLLNIFHFSRRVRTGDGWYFVILNNCLLKSNIFDSDLCFLVIKSSSKNLRRLHECAM